MQSIKNQCKKLIAEDKTEQAINMLLTATSNDYNRDVHSELVVLSASFERYKSERRKGLSTVENQSVSLSRINSALLEIIENLANKHQVEVQDLENSNGRNQNKRYDLTATKDFLSRRKWWEWMVAAGVVVSIFAGLTDIFGENIKTLIGNNSTAANTVTVLAHGPGGKDDLVLPSRGIVKLIYGDAIVSKQINNEGEATFKQISDAFFAKDARVEILFEDPEGEPYRAMRNDSLYRLERGKYVALEVKLYGLDRLKGIVKDLNTNKTIAGAKVRVQGEEAESNAYGEFTLDLPPNKQDKFQTIRAYHPDYQDYELANVPTQTQREIPILMKPKNN